MSAIDLVAWATQLLFVALALGSFVTAVRRPRPASIDAALFFGALAGVILQSRLAAVFGWTGSELSSDLSSILLVTVAYLLLRLANDFAKVPRVAMRLAELGIAVSAIALGLTRGVRLPLPLVEILLGYFAVVTILAAIVFVRASLRATGVSRRRLTAIAWGSYLLGGAILIVGVAVVVRPLASLVGTVIQIGALLSAISFGIGFIPPSQLRRVWQLPELRAFLRSAGTLSQTTDTAEVIRQIERAASAALGGRAQVGIHDPQRQTLIFHDERGRVELPVGEALSGRAFAEQRTVYIANAARENPNHVELYRAREVGSILATPMTSGDDRLGVVVSTQRRALAFDEDDGPLLELIATVSAVILQNRRLSDEAAAGRDAAEQATRAKSSFLASMSHELRTPLNAILGFSALLGEQLAASLSERQTRYLGNIRDAGEHLLELINDVLDLSKVEAGRIELRLEVVSVQTLVEPVIASTATACAARGIAFDPQIPADSAVRVDPGRVRQVLYNLTSNAVKFTPAGGRVTVLADVRAGELHFEVTDTGIGIPTDKRDRVFGAFERLHEGISDASGTGLGLALTRRLVELHGGVIDFTSTEGQGSTFRVELPVAVSGVMPAERVLVVEDDARDADLIVALVNQIGLTAEVARSVDTALASLRRAHPIAVVLDLRLPDGRGEVILRAVRAMPTHTPVIVVTVEDDDGVTRPLGADEHLTKPIDGVRLVRWLTDVVAGEVTRADLAG